MVRKTEDPEDHCSCWEAEYWCKFSGSTPHPEDYCCRHDPDFWGEEEDDE